MAPFVFVVITVNPVSKLDAYPLPHVEDLFTALSGGQLSYQQLLLDDESKKFTTINTTRGLFQYQRLPFGILSAPTTFQRTMDSLLQGLPNVLDGILVTGVNEDNHLCNLDRVMDHLESAGLTLKQSNCVYDRIS